jgi:hypothetical protein
MRGLRPVTIRCKAVYDCGEQAERRRTIAGLEENR